MSVHVLYTGLPLPGALVELTNLEHDSEPVETPITDRAGRVIFSAPRGGDWLLNLETTFSSLTQKKLLAALGEVVAREVSAARTAPARAVRVPIRRNLGLRPGRGERSLGRRSCR